MKPPTEDPRCGTDAGYQAHRTRGEERCAACKQARADYMRKRRQNAELVGRERELNRARSRALWRLADLHPETFHRLFVEESRHVYLAKAGAR